MFLCHAANISCIYYLRKMDLRIVMTGKMKCLSSAPSVSPNAAFIKSQHTPFS